MHKFVHSFLTEWRRLGLPFEDKTFVAAVSGGADSISLALALRELRQLKKLNLRFVVAHFNHNLRGAESEADERFVKEFAAKFDFELVYKIQNPKSKIENQKGNLEQNARRARYDFLVETAENLHAVGILTAHTLNDQAETFLLNLIRGSGLEGLGGMKTVRSLSNAECGLRNAEPENDSQFTKNESSETENQNTVTEICEDSAIRKAQSAILLVRPLLNWATRELTENFCREREIEFRNDSMNEDLAFKRVRIRKVLLPLLKDFNPNIVETLAKTANLLQEDFAGLEKSARDFKPNDEQFGESLDLSELIDLFPSMRRQILREWMKSIRGDLRSLDSKHLAAIENLISSRKSGRRIELPNGETVIKRGGKLFFEKTKVDKSRADNYNQGLDFESVV